MNSLLTRFIHWKKQWITMLFWLILPIFGTVSIINVTTAIQEDSKVPVGIVVEDETLLAANLVESIRQTPLIRVDETTEEDALHKLEKHELDSVFIIRNGYEEQVKRGSRNRLITSYKSDLSLAYTPVSEMIISFAQKDTGRSKAAFTVKNLSEEYNPHLQWTWDEVVEKSRQIEAEENLLRTTFNFLHTDSIDQDEVTVWKTWGLYAVFSILSTLLLFDWFIKESRSGLRSRFMFTRISFKRYSLENTLFYTVLLFLFDLLAAGVFAFYLGEPVNLQLIGALLSLRLTLNTGALIVAMQFNNLQLFYSVSFALTLLIAISSGAILPVDGITNRFTWLELVNPILPFLSGKISNLWLYLFIMLISIWFVRRDKSDA
ncbi:ABC transporter permease [Virgibacillus sp. C22-A2]|uniref:ABC transporter permease n=2 Tax=Virgibacillus tibetensis TaxID=3042313 RepID=A0ABU6KA65_9BACI|nr:ABC transporter permease [Virgibacillus sp. C22-A2]